MFGIVNETMIHIKNRPQDSSITIDELFLGMIVNVLWEDVNGYCYIETDYEYRGYVSKKKLVVNESNVTRWIEKSSHIVTGEYVDILSGISYESKTISSVMRGSHLVVTDKSNKLRTQVMLPSGKPGWIRNEFIFKKIDVRLRKKREVRQEIVSNALKYLEKQFRWGGKSPFGVDSSGFSSMVYLLSGLRVWRDSEFKEANLLKIKRDELKPGDLIYGKEYTGIYLGEDKFISASSVYASVIIRSLNPDDSDYYDIFSSDETVYACHKLLRG